MMGGTTGRARGKGGEFGANRGAKTAMYSDRYHMLLMSVHKVDFGFRVRGARREKRGFCVHVLDGLKKDGKQNESPCRRKLTRS